MEKNRRKKNITKNLKANIGLHSLNYIMYRHPPKCMLCPVYFF